MSAPKSSAPNRPLSPFMIGPYYRPQMTSMLSITHRATGVALSFGSLLLAAWLIALAMGPQAFGMVSVHMKAWYGQILLLGWSWALVYHLLNGIRHLFWDIGWGLEIGTAERSGYAVIFGSLILTAAVWAAAYLA